MHSLLQSNRLAIWCRGMTRKLGINKLLARWLDKKGYEEAFHLSLIAAIRPGDTIWDIGANVGHYTQLFAEKTGPSGCVVAFEPVPACFSELRKTCQHIPQARPMNIALGAQDKEVLMTLEKNPLGTTHRLAGKECPTQETTTVSLCTARTIVHDSPQIFPAVVKIDVEGHEEAVLLGFGELLNDPRLRSIGVEIHFGILQRNGDAFAPQRIEKFLLSSGFLAQWTDRSHIVATRETNGTR